MSQSRLRADNVRSRILDYAHDMQAMGVCSMPREEVSVRQDENGIRGINLNAFIVHDDHAQGGQPYSAGCPLCRTGLESVFTFAEGEVPKPEVVPGDGTDTKEDTTPPPDSERDREPERERLW